MDKQTIDGVLVSRDLLELIYNGGYCKTYVMKELRALLGGPSKLPLIDTHNERLIASLRNRVKELEASQPQGDPVAWQVRAICSDGTRLGWRYVSKDRFREAVSSANLSESAGGHVDWECRQLYAEQPAPVSRPAHANPPPGTEPSGTHFDNDGLDAWRGFPSDDHE